MTMHRRNLARLACLVPVAGYAGPYSLGLHDPSNLHDAPVPGFVGPHGIGKARLDDGFGDAENPDNFVNPLFFAWADQFSGYERSDSDAGFSDASYALGEVTGDHFDVVSLGDMTAAEITAGDPPGRITLRLAKPVKDRSGADLVVFENSFLSQHNTGGSGVGGVFAELAFVEVSADGVNFHRFPSASLTPSAVGGYGTVNPTDVGGLAGKHVNGNGESWGTPFDIGVLGLAQVTHVRLVDVPGNGAFADTAGNPIYDSWRTFGSGGFDLEAVGGISADMSFGEWPALAKLDPAKRGEDDDADEDGIPNLLEYAFGLVPWLAESPSTGWSCARVTEEGGEFIELVTLRDERLIDLTREIQASVGLSGWETIAVSVGGAPFQPANGHTPVISEENAGEIASIGVIRRDRIRLPATGGRRFFQLKVTRTTP